MTQDYLHGKSARILLIGHDPRLQKSKTNADRALFADYYFKPIPTKPSEKSKYGLAKSTYEQLNYLTIGKYNPEEIYITNLCSDPLPHALTGKTVLIPEDKAKLGIDRIKAILKRYQDIEFVFAMSLQVNYWLQKLEFCEANTKFLELAEPKQKGVKNKQPYYEPQQSGAFMLICGNQIELGFHMAKLIPILHSKNYPLNKKFKTTYGKCYDGVRDFFNKQIT